MVDTKSRRWKIAKNDMRDLLIRIARMGRGSNRLTTYSSLYVVLIFHGLPRDEAILHAMLIEISTEETAHGRGMLNALVLRRFGDVLPPAIFFQVAASLGRDISDLKLCWQNELDLVFGHWTNDKIIH
jgi:hypothetical protein